MAAAAGVRASCAGQTKGRKGGIPACSYLLSRQMPECPLMLT
ncbi:hypothetical protein HMPREF1986_00834 [Oribacterium sp. oral taxon 078 str. F0263]|nr:hypothetical protein HMPREF1986_00834 [Oribacterium sp. oral taxon 078 str. F0263]